MQPCENQKVREFHWHDTGIVKQRMRKNIAHRVIKNAKMFFTAVLFSAEHCIHSPGVTNLEIIGAQGFCPIQITSSSTQQFH